MTEPRKMSREEIAANYRRLTDRLGGVTRVASTAKTEAEAKAEVARLERQRERE